MQMTTVIHHRAYIVGDSPVMLPRMGRLRGIEIIPTYRNSIYCVKLLVNAVHNVFNYDGLALESFKNP